MEDGGVAESPGPVVDLKRLQERLSCLEADSERELRRAVVEALLEATHGHVGLTTGLSGHGDELFYTSTISAGSASAEPLCAKLDGSPNQDRKLWNPALPRPSECQQFVGMHHGPVPLEDIRASRTYHAFYEPLGLQDHARALLYDGERFVAWLGVMREDAASFEPADLARLNRCVPMLVGAMVAADNMRRGWDDVPLHLIFDAESLRLRLASPRASEWLSTYRRSRILDFLRALRADSSRSVCFIDGYALCAAKLVGNDGPAFHVNVRLPAPITRSPAAALTAREHEVAKLAALGATAREMAEDLEISAETVRGHIKSIYKKLEVGSRAELAAMLRGERSG